MSSETSSTPNSSSSETSSETNSGTSSGQDIFSVLGGIFKECTNKWNENANQNLEILTRDIQTLYNQFGSLVYEKSDMLNMSAEEIRKKTVEDLYNQVKFGVLSTRTNSKYEYNTSCQSKRILDDLEKKLKDEGFIVSYEIKENKTTILIEW
jgi:hypothetical protein